MTILIAIENDNKKIRKPVYEALSYAKALGDKLNKETVAVALGEFENGELEKIGKYGVKNVIHIKNSGYNSFNSKNYATAVAEIAKEREASIILVPQTFYGKAYAPRLAVKTGYAFLSGITELLEPSEGGFQTKRIAFSNKAIETVRSKSDKVVVTIKGGAYSPTENPVEISVAEKDVPLADNREKVVNKEVFSGGVPLPEASIVVSAGRGLKGPENWGMVEELAELLGAATACSRPVAESGWRPHHEHVGQTGVQISPDVYIAIGISGAIQHLAGVASSKTIIVINKDPEAPFFQSCDYGIVGDAFEVVPKLIEAIKKYKQSH